MRDDPIAPLAPELQALVEALRPCSAPGEAQRQRLLGRLESTLGLVPGTGGPGAPSSPSTGGGASPTAAGAGGAAGPLLLRPLPLVLSVLMVVGGIGALVFTLAAHRPIAVRRVAPSAVSQPREDAPPPSATRTAPPPSGTGRGDLEVPSAPRRAAGARRSDTVAAAVDHAGPGRARHADKARPSRAAEGDRASSRDSDLAAERVLLEGARAALARRDVDAALEGLRRHEQQFPRGRLGELREALLVEALVTAGRHDDALARANRFRARFPRSLFLPVVERALGSGR